MAIPNPVDVLEQIRRRRREHRIKYDINAFPSCKLGGRNEVSVSCNQDDLIHLPLECHGSHIKAEPHIYALLDHIQFKIFIGRREGRRRPQPFSDCVRFRSPCTYLLIESAKTHCNLSGPVKPLVQSQAHSGLGSFSQVV